MFSKTNNTADAVGAIPKYLKNKACSGTFELDVISYAGYVTADRQKDNHLYYWFFESRETDPKHRDAPPLVVWLNGGPGASSLAGLFLENGPFLLLDHTDGGARICANPNGWNQKAHLMYWDQPVGTGFSHTGTGSYAKTEPELSLQFFNALQGFFALHPVYRGCDLYITGESYAGKYIPNMARMIGENNPGLPAGEKINLKGIALGDGWMHPRLQTRLQIDFGYEMGFTDTGQKRTAETLYRQYGEALDRNDMAAAFHLGNNVSDMVLACGGNPDIYDVRRWQDLPIHHLADYLSCAEVKQAIHAVGTWQFADASSIVAENLINDLEADVTGLFPKLIETCRMLFYTGNFDMSCGFAGTEQILYSWNHLEKWRDIPRRVWTRGIPAVTGDLPPTLGYVKEAGNLSQMVIPDSGHQVPASKPEASRLMIEHWIFGKPFAGYLPATVQARVRWADTGIAISGEVKSAVRYLCGRWTANPATGFVDAEGSPGLRAKQGYTLAGANEGALCGKVGADGEVFFIGRGRDIPAGLSGPLFLCINDDLEGVYGAGFTDNDGSVTVAVIQNAG